MLVSRKMSYWRLSQTLAAGREVGWSGRVANVLATIVEWNCHGDTQTRVLCGCSGSDFNTRGKRGLAYICAEVAPNAW
jgi:hypothetical protein